MRLAINIDHIATLRNARGGIEPDPLKAALLCEQAGAKGIVCHLREDRRHIRDEDVFALRKNITTKLDLEMATTDEIVDIAVDLVPDLVTLVPEHRQELTTEGGLDVRKQKRRLEQVINHFHRHAIAVSLFIDPTKENVEISKEIGTDMIEIHTGEYANATTSRENARELKRIAVAAQHAKSIGLGVNAGHGINYVNVKRIAALKEIDELSIGHAIISYAVHVGLNCAVREMKALMKR
ncbi:MAG: pyridoxine 5'-phosphate synthase [bacterium]